tara:strand:- start:360 stop:572 length:213 start_codon:yes stop_codon:yes gene_type:complete
MKITKKQLKRIIKEEKAKILQEQPQQLDLDYILDLVGEALAEGGAITTGRDRDAVINYMDFLVRRFGGRR